jgi:outer membrane immunogenic protein
MKKFLLASIALVALGAAGTATAADMRVKAPIYKAPPVVVSDPWTGFYVGGNIGYSWGDWGASSNQLVFNFESLTANPKVNGVVGGLQAGFNWRGNGPWLWGIEADIQVTGEKATQTWTDPGLAIIIEPPSDFVPRPGGPALLAHEWKFPWFATLRLRAGVTPVEHWLFYVTGGLAIGESKYSFSFSQPGAALILAPTTYALSKSTTQVGFAVGVGTEVKLAADWSVKLEYLYIDLGKVSIDTLDIDGFPFHVDYRVRDHILRVGLNYRFGGPVIAKY